MDRYVFGLRDQQYMRNKVESKIQALKMGIMDSRSVSGYSKKEKNQMVKYYNRNWISWFLNTKFDLVEITDALNKYTHCCDYLEEINAVNPFKVEFACYVVYISLEGKNVSSCDIFVCFFCFWKDNQRFFALVKRNKAKVKWDCEIDTNTIALCS